MFSTTFNGIRPNDVLETEKGIFISGPNLVIYKNDGTKRMFLETKSPIEMCKYITGNKEYIVAHCSGYTHIFDNKGNTVDVFEHPKNSVDKIRMNGDSLLYSSKGLIYKCDIDGSNNTRTLEELDDYDDIYRGDYSKKVTSNSKFTYNLAEYTLTAEVSFQQIWKYVIIKEMK